ncbi:MAG: hypothetical protein Rubg2KO_22720 [Rubricoccaceae bacterium]
MEHCIGYSMTRRVLSRIALFAIGAMWGVAGVAQQQGTLVFLNLPEGATVQINEASVVLERDERRGAFVLHPEATVAVVVEASEVGTIRTLAEVLGGAVTTIQIKEGQLDTRRTVAGVLLPGITQLRNGRPVVGGGVILGLAGAAAGTWWAGTEMDDARVAADDAAAQYAAARTTVDAVAARDAHALAVSDAESARRLRLAFVAVGVGVAIASALDVGWNHSRSTTLEASSPRRPIVAVRPNGLGATVQVRL